MAEEPNLQKAFGGGDRTPGDKPAPTKLEVAQNPGAYAGTAHDPCELIVPRQATRVFGSGEYAGPMVFADWYRAEPGPAMLWFANVYVANLDLDKLSEGQRKRMGL